jgi:hypothetical protein
MYNYEKLNEIERVKIYETKVTILQIIAIITILNII